MNTFQAFFIAVLQGITELFPISSLGHAVILPSLLGWRIDQHSADFLPFLVVLHVGTAAALLLYFWRDWIDLGLGLITQQGSLDAADARRLLGLIVMATLPAVVVGFVLEKWLRELFGSPVIAALFLIANGFLLFVGDRLRRGDRGRSLESLTWKHALMIGCWQCTALLPGISRSGATMVGGLLAGLATRKRRISRSSSPHRLLPGQRFSERRRCYTVRQARSLHSPLAQASSRVSQHTRA
jgi:undecaprenyl-diphosphatase